MQKALLVVSLLLLIEGLNAYCCFGDPYAACDTSYDCTCTKKSVCDTPCQCQKATVCQTCGTTPCQCQCGCKGKAPTVYFPEVEYPVTVVEMKPYYSTTCWCT